MSDFTKFVDLASERLGGRAVAANDEFFAPKENLLKASPPIFIGRKYTDRGKWMDGWETRRRRTPGYDWCIIRLGLPGILRGVVIDTSHFKGNFPEHCSLEARTLDGPPFHEERKRLLADTTRWIEVLPKSPLRGDSPNLFAIAAPQRFTHLRFKIYPDGGVARLHVHGEVVPDWKKLAGRRCEIDLAAVEKGGSILASSDEFFGAPLNLLMPGRPRNMGEGWETRRRRGPGHDWVIVKLGLRGTIRRVEVDTSHFKGNFPESCSLEGCQGAAAGAAEANFDWKELLPRTKLKANKRHIFKREIRDMGPATRVRFNIFPDGGIARLRIYGTPSLTLDASTGLARLNALSEGKARAALLICCGSTGWAEQMAAQRPFASAAQLYEAAGRIWAQLDPKDWSEAFRSHPQIGEKNAAGEHSAQAPRWSQQEQSSLQQASAATLAVLAEANRAYRNRFGYIFIVCATGKTSEEMLTILRQRLANDPETELRIAADEQRKITRLRLEKLLDS